MQAEIVRETLREMFEHALWQSRCSPGARSARAAKSFRRLVATADQIEAGILFAYAELWEGEPDRTAHRKLMESVGCGFIPLSASEFVIRFIAERTGGA